MAEGELACSTECVGESEADSGMQTADTNSNEEVCSAGDQEDSNCHEANTNYDSSDGGGGSGILRCDRCDYENLSRTALMAHIASCSASVGSDHRKMFECDVCQMKFSNGANMRRHKMRHTGVKPYECRVCQKRFFRKDHLAEHFTTHTKTLPFHCPICNRGFQRQIAMRAHFQNEHVGQNDMIKSCPLCSYRAGSMKSLRVHFFNRHGIDLDRPTNPGEASTTLSGNGGGVSGGGGGGSGGGGGGGSSGNGGSDSGDSNRSGDNATPPMHFLTPHVEISMADPPPQSYSPTPQGQDQVMVGESLVNGDSPGSPQSGDSNTPSSSQLPPQAEVSPITPSVSLIPIKQEVEEDKRTNGSSGPVNLTTRPLSDSPLTSLIKVSPLKSLLRDDLRRSSSSLPRSNKVTPEPPTSSAVDVPPPPPMTPDSLWRPPPHTIASTKRLNCIFCGITFPDQTLYFLHKGCHSESNPWKCNICGEQCCNVYDFNSHLLSKTHQ